MADGDTTAYGQSHEHLDDEDVPLVTLVDGTDFVVCSPSGSIEGSGRGGYFSGDTRMLSQLSVAVDGQAVRFLDHRARPRSLVSIGAIGTPVRPHLAVTSTLSLGGALDLMIVVEHLESGERSTSLTVTFDADFADIFDVKQGSVVPHGTVSATEDDGALLLDYTHDGFERRLRVTAGDGARIASDHVEAVLELHARGQATTTVRFAPEIPKPGSAAAPHPPSEFVRRLSDGGPRISSEPGGLGDVVRRGAGDLTTLLLADPESPERPIVAAGSPWFLALFGRDSILSAWEMLPLGTDVALGVLEALAARQGRREDERTAEQPGRILHEVRRGEAVARSGGWGEVYYGTADATPLFVMLLAETWRWGAPVERVAALLPAAERAVEWIERSTVAGGGVVRSGAHRSSGTAVLVNQSWKDSDDAIRHPDGSVADGPVSTVEVQGYCEAAERALADLRDGLGGGDGSRLREQADRRRAAIDEAYWLEHERCYALALDAGGGPVSSPCSNAGHLLWSGTALPSRREQLSARLMRPDLFSGWGVRTMSAATAGYNPLSYHCGSVWPHDSAIVAAGMLSTGCHGEGRRLAVALWSAAVKLDGRLPELFGGFDARRAARPVPYPTACSPQAWAAGAPLLLTRALLGVDPDVPSGVVVVDPCLPPGVAVEVSDLPLGPNRLDLRAVGEHVEHCEVSGPDSLVVLEERRRPGS